MRHLHSLFFLLTPQVRCSHHFSHGQRLQIPFGHFFVQSWIIPRYTHIPGFTNKIYIYYFFLQFKMSNWVVAYMCVCIGLPGPPFMVPDEQVASLFGEWCWGESRLSGFTMTNATERLEDVRGRRLSLSFLCRFLQGASVTWQRCTRTTPWRRDSEPGTWTTWRKMCTSSPSRALRNQRLGSSGRQILGHCWSIRHHTFSLK